MRICWKAVLVVVVGVLWLPIDSETQANIDGRRLGLVPTDPALYRSLHSASVPLGAATLPSAVDLSESFPHPDSQGPVQDSCTAWALGYAIRSYQFGRTHNPAQSPIAGFFSQPNNLFSPSYLFKRTKLTRGYPNTGCAGGISIPDALSVLSNEGITTMQDFAYNPTNCDAVPGHQNMVNAANFKVAGWSRVGKDYADIDIDVMKALIAAGFPLAIGIKVDKPFQDLNSDTYSQYAGPFIGFHAVAVVGYDNVRQAFLIQNSWGPSWGSGGTAWVTYTVSRTIITEAYVIQDSGLPLPRVLPEITFHLGDRGLQNDWMVIVGSHPALLPAQQQVVSINARFEGFVASLYEKSAKTQYYTVAIGSHLSKERAAALRDAAIAKGLPHDSYIWLPN